MSKKVYDNYIFLKLKQFNSNLFLKKKRQCLKIKDRLKKRFQSILTSTGFVLFIYVFLGLLHLRIRFLSCFSLLFINNHKIRKTTSFT